MIKLDQIDKIASMIATIASTTILWNKFEKKKKNATFVTLCGSLLKMDQYSLIVGGRRREEVPHVILMNSGKFTIY